VLARSPSSQSILGLTPLSLPKTKEVLFESFYGLCDCEMEVLAAIGVAGNIVQFVDFGGKLISKTAEIYKSGTGALIENVDIETATNDLIRLTTKLQDSADSVDDRALKELCQSCGGVAHQLLTVLDKVKAKGKHEKWKSFRRALLSVWNKEDIAALEQRLVRFRNELNLRVVLDLRSVRKILAKGSANVMRNRERLIRFKDEHSGKLEELDVTNKKLVEAILDQRELFKAVQDAIVDQWELSKAAHDDTRTIIQRQYLEKLQVAAQARFNCYERRDDTDCLPSTRSDLLQKIRDWADSEDERPIFWLRGLAGTGKSTIARTIAHEYSDTHRLAASFFFSRDIGGDVRNARKFFATIAAQLAEISELLKGHICDAIAQCSDITTRAPREQWSQLVLGPLLKLKGGDVSHRSLVLVVDALDECDGENDIRAIVQLLSEARLLRKVRLRILITSRPETPIRQSFGEMPETDHQDFVLHDISRSIVDGDIRLFVEYHFAVIRRQPNFTAGWPGRETIEAMVHHAAGLFIWVATAFRYLWDRGRFTEKRLDAILKGNVSKDTPEKGLDTIYLTVLNGSIRNFNEEEEEDYCSMLKRVLGTVVILSSSLSATSLASLLSASKEDVDESLKDLHAILDPGKEDGDPIRLHHPSFRDFLLNRKRCDDPRFWVDEREAHELLADGCIALMTARLKRDICNLLEPGILAKDISDAQRERRLPLDLRYACQYWVQHLKKSKTQLEDDSKVSKVHKFLQQKFLHWLEVLSLIGKTSEGVHAIILLESMVTVSYILRECED
jgi:hypothetical protein